MLVKDVVIARQIEIPGYTIFRLDRPNKVVGGVCAFVKTNLKFERLSDK